MPHGVRCKDRKKERRKQICVGIDIDMDTQLAVGGWRVSEGYHVISHMSRKHLNPACTSLTVPELLPRMASFDEVPR
jgi:hypothetical protein